MKHKKGYLAATPNISVENRWPVASITALKDERTFEKWQICPSIDTLVSQSLMVKMGWG